MLTEKINNLTKNLSNVEKTTINTIKNKYSSKLMLLESMNKLSCVNPD